MNYADKLARIKINRNELHKSNSAWRHKHPVDYWMLHTVPGHIISAKNIYRSELLIYSPMKFLVSLRLYKTLRISTVLPSTT